MATKLEFVVNSLFENNGANLINGFAKYEKVIAFYGANKIALPVSLTFVETKSIDRLTKDETISILRKGYASDASDEDKENASKVLAPKDGEKVTFTNTVLFSESCKVVGYNATATKLVDMLNPGQLEEYQKQSRKNGNAIFAVSEIPAIIEMLNNIAEKANKETK